jgi:hypothetical protein
VLFSQPFSHVGLESFANHYSHKHIYSVQLKQKHYNQDKTNLRLLRFLPCRYETAVRYPENQNRTDKDVQFRSQDKAMHYHQIQKFRYARYACGHLQNKSAHYDENQNWTLKCGQNQNLSERSGSQKKYFNNPP